jgi:hypothetical protein
VPRTHPQARVDPRAHRAGVHLHRFQRVDDDWFSNCSLYGCRCGVIRPGM